ncbi:MAG: hypothetical protein PVI38_13620, partial [Desulfobacterales bacterium]
VVILLTYFSKWRWPMATVYLRDFPEDLHRIVKSEAALEGITLKAIIIKALEEYLKKKKKGGK